MEYIQGAAAHNFVPAEESRIEVDNILDGLVSNLLDSVFETPQPQENFDPAAKEVVGDQRPRVFKRHSQVNLNNPNSARLKESNGGGKLNLVTLFDKSNDISSKPSLFSGDDDELALQKFEMRTKLLEAQLDNRNKELRLALDRLRILELTIIDKDEQMEIIPDLLVRASQATQYEEELVQLKECLECLSEELTTTESRLEALKTNWLGRFSLWLCEKQ